jgi:hypothetical protein
LEDDFGILEELLLRRCELRVSQERFREVVLANRFERMPAEDGSARRQVFHERQGLRGLEEPLHG